MRSVRWCAAAMLMTAAACQRAETPEQMQVRIDQESQAARQSIEAAAVAFAQHLNAGRTDSVAAFYMDEGRMMPPNGPAAVGKAAIKSLLDGMMQTGQFNLSLKVGSVVANGPLAVERGTYTMGYTPGPGAPAGAMAMTDTGKYLVHWHKVGDRWLMADDIWNSDIPMPPPPPPAPARK